MVIQSMTTTAIITETTVAIMVATTTEYDWDRMGEEILLIALIIVSLFAGKMP